VDVGVEVIVDDCEEVEVDVEDDVAVLELV
jgi:hypothetical protein